MSLDYTKITTSAAAAHEMLRQSVASVDSALTAGVLRVLDLHKPVGMCSACINADELCDCRCSECVRDELDHEDWRYCTTLCELFNSDDLMMSSDL